MDKTDFIKKELPRWYAHNMRELPWRQTKDPYTIWLSEIILQQTQVSQALPYYYKITNAFPTLTALAQAEEHELLVLWQGLGYYSRARNMHSAARYIKEKLNGVFPKNYKDLLNLKGVGEYTAAAIASIAYNEPVAAIDGNVQRIVSRIFGVWEPVDSTAGKHIIKQIANQIICTQQTGDFNQAMMDFGSTVCKSQNPNCPKCPFSDICEARKSDSISKLPAKKAKQKKQNLFLYYFCILYTENNKQYLVLRKRNKKGIWQNLYDFPDLCYTRKKDLKNVVSDFETKYHYSVHESDILILEKNYKYVLSHRNVYAQFYLLPCSLQTAITVLNSEKELLPVPINKLKHYPFSQLINKFFEDNQNIIF